VDLVEEVEEQVQHQEDQELLIKEKMVEMDLEEIHTVQVEAAEELLTLEETEQNKETLALVEMV
tara:strand:- start:295 stop:486 length:192 start_codon:yes stop_codon:yes gene_type:complete